MFENIIGRSSLVETLSRMIDMDQLPQSMLFEGMPYNGKLTIALELARILCCQVGKSPHDCSCEACVQHRHRQNQAITILGNRYFDSEIRVCHTLVQEDISLAPLLITALRNLTNRFDPRIWEDKQIDVGTSIETLEEDMHHLQNSILPKDLLSNVKRLIACLPKELIPVSAVRHAIMQAHYTPGFEKRIFIIEYADELSVASTNSLLKIIEEPPDGVYFILTARYADTLAAALRSRLQRFYVSERGAKEEKEFLSTVFKQTKHSTLRALIYTQSFEHSPKELGQRMALCLLGRLDYNEYQSCVEKIVSNRELLRASCYELSETLRSTLREIGIGELQKIEHCWQEVRLFLRRVLNINMKTEHALEVLYYRCRQNKREHIA